MRKLLLLTVIASILIAAAPVQQESLPDYAFVEGLVGHGQTYPLSCESRSAADLAGYWGLSVSETDFFHNLPTSDNPEKGFVGSVYGTWGQTPPNPYGVHSQPIAALLREYGLNAQAHVGLTMRQLKTEIANGRPVIVWVIGHVWSGTPVSYTARDGSVVTVAAYEHSMIAYGYDLSGVYLIDAGNGSRASYSYSNFRTSWGVLGNLAVTANGKIGEEVSIPANTGDVGDVGDAYVVQPGDYLSMLASQWGISWQDLAALNGIMYPYVIYPGQVLYTGSGNAPTPAATQAPAPEPTATPKPTTAPTPTPEPTPPPVETYTVQQGDHLMQIAADLEIDWRDIVMLNDLTYPYLVYPGQVLVLSDDGGRPSQDKNQQSQGSYEEYVVKEGEHLMQIARAKGLAWMDIADLNNLTSPYTLSAGQKLLLPGAGNSSSPEKGVDPPVEVSEYSGTVYVCQPGDFIYALARTFGVSWQALASYNQITYPYIVYPGQEIRIP
jgi:LysM repeat protein/uncharacterized protein YvpB